MDDNNKRAITLTSIVILAAMLVCVILSVTRAINNLAQRPLYGNFSGNVTTGDYEYPEIMDTDALMGYLQIYPSFDNEQPTEAQGAGEAAQPMQDTEKDDALDAYRAEIESNITSGKWQGFPYVKLDGHLRYSKAAVDEWLTETSKQRAEFG
ncbi:MAG: hypothetical protein LBN30_00110 [Oscillospiraceae bacterium]|jgi:hypothetical protein|nr:hypothetical protein [Oscillospiraceae bacterium]